MGSVAKAKRPRIMNGLLPVSPLVQRRWLQFMANRRSVISLWIVISIFVISLFADVLANDKPIVGMYKGELVYPILVEYPESKFGGFLGRTDYRDPFIKSQFAEHGWLMYTPIPHHFHRTTDLGIEGAAPYPPSATHLLGTDDQGRDMLARLIHGIRISFFFGFIYVIVTSAIGIFVGAISGFFGGWLDLIFQRVLEVYGSLPTFFMLIILAGMLKPNFWILLAILIAFGWTGMVGVVRLEFLRGRNLEYVKAAKAMGVPDLAIMWRHIFPNAMIGPITMLPFALAGSITVLSSLDFLGFGLPTDSPSLGEMTRQAFNNYRHAWWILLTVFGGLGSLTILMVFIGEGVRNAMDPRSIMLPAPADQIKGKTKTQQAEASA